jgi:3-oxoacyl-[acyl-carrier protein] reductase
MSGFKDKIVLVTGGSRGIGRACAVAFAKAGAALVVINYAGNEAAAQESVKLVQEAGAKAEAVKFDVADSAACSAAVENIVKTHGRLDVLVNNAGVAVDGLVMRMKDEDWDKQLDTNLKGAFSLIRAASRPMMKQRSGRIINISSVVGALGNPGQINYVASKAGVVGMTKASAKELSSRGITVNAVAPGFIETDMTDKLSGEIQSQLLLQIPLARLGQPEDIAKAVRFLASDDASYMTGQTIHVDGGMYM